MPRMITITCACCQLPQRVRDYDGEDPATLCGTCVEHRGADDRKRRRRSEDHEAMYWTRCQEARAAAMMLEARVSEYRQKLAAAFDSRDQAIRVLRRVTGQHEPTRGGCSCGKRNCPTLELVDSAWVRERIEQLEARGAVDERWSWRHGGAQIVSSPARPRPSVAALPLPPPADRGQRAD